MVSTDIFIVFLFALLLAFLPAKIADKKANEFILWYVYGLILLPIALGHAFLVKTDRTSDSHNPTQFKKCSYCTELIALNADICKYCYAMNSDDPAQESDFSKNISADYKRYKETGISKQNMLSILYIAFILFYIGLYILSKSLD